MIKKTIFLLLIVVNLNATEFIVEDVNSSKKHSSWIALPYIFSTDSMGLTVGAVGIFSGYIQPQMTIVATAFIGSTQEVEKLNSDDSTNIEYSRAKGFILAIDGYRPNFSKRTFISFLGSYAYYPNQRLYLDGSHQSKQDLDSNNPKETTPFQTQGFNNWFKLDARYVLPWGESKESVLPTIKLKRGIAVNRDKIGGGIPFITGQSTIGSEYFYTKWTADKLIQKPEFRTNGLRFFFIHDNTDYPDNPSRGYSMKLQTSIDFGWTNSSQSWNSIEAQYSHYIEMPKFSWARQNVIALNTWSAYSPSWDKSKKLNPDDPNSIIDAHQPPMFEGARLGGFYRMRGYDSNRFNDKSALYFATEYRVIPNFNPMRNQKWSPIAIDWFQAVIFAEAGRVAPEYNISTLLNDMKYDAGFSIRALAAKVPLRFDMAFSDEGSSMWVMVKQPF